MSKLPAPPSFKSTIIQITPNSSSSTTKTSSYQKNSNDNSSSNNVKRQISSDNVPFLGNSPSASNSNPKRQKVKSSEKSLEEIERKKKENKAAHSIIEKKRRIKLNREFEALKIIVPACRNSIINNNYNNNGHSASANDANKDKINDGMYKLTILQASVDYINYLHEIIRIMHLKEKKLNFQLGNVNQQDNDDDHIAFAKLDLKLEKYRDLDIDFNYVEIMKIFKYMNAYSRIVNKNDKIDKKKNSSYDAKLNYFVNPESINLYDDSDFDKFLLSKGIKQTDIDTFHLFFDIVNVSKNPETNYNEISNNDNNINNDDSNGNDIKFKSSIFSILDKSKASMEQNTVSQPPPNTQVTKDNSHLKLQTQRNDISNTNSYNILNNNSNNANQSKYSVSGSSVSSSYTAPTTVTPATSLLNQPYNISIFNNTSPAINWKKFSPNISPATKYLDNSLIMKSNNNTTTNLSNEFQLPQPSIDIPVKLERQNSMNSFTDFLNKGNHTSNNNGITMSPSGLLGSGSTFQQNGSPNFYSSRSSNNGIKINTSLNISKSSNSSEFFTLSPMTFSSIIKSPKFDGMLGNNLIGGNSYKEKKSGGECKMASEALMSIRKRSNPGKYTGLNSDGDSTGLNDNNSGIVATENGKNEDNNNFSTSPNNSSDNKKDSSTMDETGKRYDSKINTILN